MLKNYKENLTEGPILKKMIFFILPLIATSILQQLFHTADMSVVGRFAGDDAYAAVGSTGTVVGLFIEFFMGFSVGVNVVVGHAIGRKDEGEVSKGVHTAILFSVICGLIIAIIGIPFTRKLLELTSVPREILDMAALYLRIYFCGMPFLSKSPTRLPRIIVTEFTNTPIINSPSKKNFYHFTIFLKFCQ